MNAKAIGKLKFFTRLTMFEEIDPHSTKGRYDHGRYT